MEVSAMSQLYNVGISIWQLSKSDELVSCFNNAELAARNGLQTLGLVRHRGVHYNVAIGKDQKLPLLTLEGCPIVGDIKNQPSWSSDTNLIQSFSHTKVHQTEMKHDE